MPTDIAALRPTALHAIDVYSRQRTVITSVAYTLSFVPALLDELAAAEQRIATLTAALRPFAEPWDARAGVFNVLALETLRHNLYPLLKAAHTALAGEGDGDETK
jgi:hypothetical protein